MKTEINANVGLYPVKQSGILKFLIPSLLGLFIFLMPIVYQGDLNIPLGVISQFLADLFERQLPYVATIFMVISALASTCAVTRLSFKLAVNHDQIYG